MGAKRHQQNESNDYQHFIKENHTTLFWLSMAQLMKTEDDESRKMWVDYIKTITEAPELIRQSAEYLRVEFANVDPEQSMGVAMKVLESVPRLKNKFNKAAIIRLSEIIAEFAKPGHSIRSKLNEDSQGVVGVALFLEVLSINAWLQNPLSRADIISSILSDSVLNQRTKALAKHTDQESQKKAFIISLHTSIADQFQFLTDYGVNSITSLVAVHFNLLPSEREFNELNLRSSYLDYLRNSVKSFL